MRTTRALFVILLVGIGLALAAMIAVGVMGR